MSYHEHTDYRYAKHIHAGAPASFEAFTAWDAQVMRGDDKVVPPKYTELMAVAVALTTQCPYCIEAHTAAAQSAGATKQELAETIMIAAALRAGGGVAHGFMAMKFFDRAENGDATHA
ncbi:carboxymuconolactone decarboxylase family protein [Streptomyces chromofuscus]|uniref:carboxymuconolactone decarboxylase family protein n=1 Tax=Streptomyces chromofuscus TaxID=42881 RepID=UPI00167A6B82|nr:carboxymuconolactone decarboxylase family protein [Streptomyces chromofuscus]GGT38042.1 alkyl hydroperoxide reductase AhpD [Streptomyces chromofuscus]